MIMCVFVVLVLLYIDKLLSVFIGDLSLGVANSLLAI